MSAPGTTPGPWLVNPASAWVEVPDRDAPICALLWPTDLRSEDETFANAALIAAAPDLYAALERAREYIFYMPTPVGVPEPLLTAIDAALAKASPSARSSECEK